MKTTILKVIGLMLGATTSGLAVSPSQIPLAATPLAAAQCPPTNHHHVVVFVWDGMRPDFVTEQNCPALFHLANRGVLFSRHHPVYLSSTEVNGTALFTGGYPGHDGVIGNNEYRPDINPLQSVHTESLAAVRKGDQLTHGRYLLLPTVPEILHRAGLKTAVVGAKPVALLADRVVRDSAERGATVFEDSTLPAGLLATITSHWGVFPAENATNFTRNDWATEALLDPLWAEGVPEFSLLWFDQPDLAQHQTAPGSDRSRMAIRNADANLGKVIHALQARGQLDDTDLIVVSDHGFSTISDRADLAVMLQKAGLPATRQARTKPAPGDIIVVSNGGSTMVYVIGHDRKRVRKIVELLQGWPFSGVIFTRQAMAGTFALSQVHLNDEAAPDVLLSMRWTTARSTNGTPGLLTFDDSGYGPGQGGHASLSAFDMRNTLVAAGPDFRTGTVDDLPTGNTDIAPTILWILGLNPPRSMDGRVLSEALRIPGPKVGAPKAHHLEASCPQGATVWHQYLNFTQLNGVTYYDEGNGQQAAK